MVLHTWRSLLQMCAKCCKGEIHFKALSIRAGETRLLPAQPPEKFGYSVRADDFAPANREKLAFFINSFPILYER